MLKRCLCLLVGCVCWFLLNLAGLSEIAFAQSQRLPLAQVPLNNLQQQQQQIDQQRSQLSQERTRLKSLERAAEKTLVDLQKGVKVTTQHIQASDAQLQQETKKLSKLEIKLATAAADYEQKQVSTIARLQFLQRQYQRHGWAVLLQSKSLNQFLDRRYQLRRVHQADQHTLMALKTAADRLNQQRDLVEQAKNKITLLTQQLLAQKVTLEDQVVYQKQSITRLNHDRRAMQAAETQLEQDSRTLASFILQRLATGDRSAFRGTGQLLIPCIGEITSPFGWRLHPVLGYERFHSGLDIGADYGTIIHAAERGVVIFADWYGGYGNAVIVDHGGGISTLYAHTSELYVVEGQAVQRGQAIAAVGSTGLSTGPHLHFEVRQDGEPVDPGAFL